LEAAAARAWRIANLHQSLVEPIAIFALMYSPTAIWTYGDHVVWVIGPTVCSSVDVVQWV